MDASTPSPTTPRRVLADHCMCKLACVAWGSPACNVQAKTGITDSTCKSMSKRNALMRRNNRGSPLFLMITLKAPKLLRPSAL